MYKLKECGVVGYKLHAAINSTSGLLFLLGFAPASTKIKVPALSPIHTSAIVNFELPTTAESRGSARFQTVYTPTNPHDMADAKIQLVPGICRQDIQANTQPENSSPSRVKNSRTFSPPPLRAYINRTPHPHTSTYNHLLTLS